MSFLLKSSRVAAVRPIISSRTFTVSSIRHLKEGDRDSPGLADCVEKHKEDLLRKQKDGTGHWKPELASHSEEIVVADRDGVVTTIEEMQKTTVKHVEEKHK